MDRPIVIDEKRGIKISLGVLIHFIITVALVCGAYFSIRQEVNAATKLGAENATSLALTQEKLEGARMDLRGLTSKIDQFIDSYNRDANRYIRDPKDWRR